MDARESIEYMKQENRYLKRKVITINVKENLLKRLERKAKHYGCTTSEYIEYMIINDTYQNTLIKQINQIHDWVRPHEPDEIPF